MADSKRRFNIKVKESVNLLRLLWWQECVS